MNIQTKPIELLSTTFMEINIHFIYVLNNVLRFSVNQDYVFIIS